MCDMEKHWSIEAKNLALWFTMITREWCGPCMKAKDLLKKQWISFTEIDFGTLTEQQKGKVQSFWHPTFPMIFTNSLDWFSQDDLLWGAEDLVGYLSWSKIQWDTADSVNKTLGVEPNRSTAILSGWLTWLWILTADMFAWWIGMLSSSVAAYILSVIIKNKGNSENMNDVVWGMKVASLVWMALSWVEMLDIYNFWLKLWSILWIIAATDMLHDYLTGKWKWVTDFFKKKGDSDIMNKYSIISDNATIRV